MYRENCFIFILMNEYARTLLQNKITKVLSDAKTLNNINHPGLIGHLKESFISNLLRPFLNNDYSVGSGKVTDYNGSKSKEIDLLIYSNSILPPFFFHEEEKVKVYPIESVLKCIEVKSILNKQTLGSTYQKCKYLDDNLVMTSGYFDDFGLPLPHIYTQVKYDFFGFSCNAKTDFKEYFLNTYKKIDPLWDTDPLITNVCVANKGWFAFTTLGWTYLPYDDTNSLNEEVIGYLCASVHGLETVALSRGYPRIGQYLIKSRVEFQYKNTPIEKV